MVVLDQFYQILESPTPTVSPLWKAAHITACIVCAVCGFLTAFTFGGILDTFGYNCILNAEIVFDDDNYLNTSGYSYDKEIHAMDLTGTVWGPESSCNFAQFTPLVIMISAIIWGIYFGIISKGGAGYGHDLFSRPWSIVYPSIFFTSIFFIVYVISTLQLKWGGLDFCAQFKPEFNNTGCIPEIGMYENQFREDKTKYLFEFYPNMLIAILSSEIGIWSWVFQLVMCILRVCCAADFDIQLVTVMTKEEEKVENIVEFAEMEDMEV
ncbi:hypothetical protein Zmor_021043 [Zophobas morio]|uniref:Uncharacterized protein n=1 Tax=Zophobas morio TaxID=2755281 RepID=A0AA38I558_9CUCU|nr:hypothetical protein Zmor_021043 [Zophobas morio]